MKINKAVSKRINNLLVKKDITAYQLTLKSLIPPSTLYNILNKENKSINLATIYKLAHGFDMTILEFFDDKLFNDEEILKELI